MSNPIELQEEPSEAESGDTGDHSVPVKFLTQFVETEFKMAQTDERLRGILKRGAAGDVVSRAAWGARPPKGRTALNSPSGSTAHWEGPRMGYFDHGACASKVRGIQAFHMNTRGWDDIAYTSIVCPHGVIYAGRWWGTRTAANGTNAGNAAHYAHCALIGEGDNFSIECKQGLKRVFILANQQGSAGDGEKCHSDWKATACPGNGIRAFVRAGFPVDGTPTPPSPAPVPTPPSDNTWYEEMIAMLPLIDFRPAGSGQLVRHHLVDNIQGLLKGTLYGPCDPGGIDGLGGKGTLSAVKQFQTMRGIGVDGVVGPNTWRALVTH